MAACNLAAKFVEVASAHGAREALVDGPVRISHRDALRRSAAVADRLLARGVRPGMRVAILLPNE